MVVAFACGIWQSGPNLSQIVHKCAPPDASGLHPIAGAADIEVYFIVTGGLRHGGAMVARKGGGIEIVAAGTARISGSLRANASGRRSAGTIIVHSGKGTVVAASARISAQGAAPSPRATAGATAGTPSSS